MERRLAFGELEKEQFHQFMREYEAFCGVAVLTFGILSNHFHILLQVPKAPEIPLSDEALLQRVEALSGSGGSKATRQQLTWFRERNQHEEAEKLRRRILARMWDLTAFMKLLKQRFSQWFNRRHQRCGTLWEARFKSLLVEGQGEALAAVAAYIDLNPMRAGIINDPMQYRWGGYGRAMMGDPLAVEGLRAVMAGALRTVPASLEPAEALRQYRMWLYVQGEQTEGTDQEGRPLRKGFSTQEVLQVMLQKGRVPLNQYLRMRVRYFVDGVVLGSRAYVNEIFGALRKRFGRHRQDGARRMRGVESEGLFVLRDLKRDVFGGTTKVSGGATAAGAAAPSG